ncbi:MAG: hypothetical protein D8M57_06480 [Candidatus Scalindua sp. AMX11]|nr:MAG: hypothetical protein DWQ00_13915 [Candidatus Scalindua sp.]TDE65728.1 MAG: hypothetical protein D8M57_06480 [Candidatus Scalindua sp. AMX11]GJQ59667.1 MAG: hypothetical protein SCALA701_24680 [Candidatus Scalindua sp.]
MTLTQQLFLEIGHALKKNLNFNNFLSLPRQIMFELALFTYLIKPSSGNPMVEPKLPDIRRADVAIGTYSRR